MHEAQSAPPAELTRALLAWYDRHHRDLPWRIPPSRQKRPDPYTIWLSEIMLQQTRVETVRPYFSKFVSRWPDVQALAAAPPDEVLATWAGLGYYSRARNLMRCAEVIVAQHGGRFPGSAAELARLPGIGPYTSAAIAAIAWGEPVAAVDGNVERVIARLHALDRRGNRIRELAQAMVPRDRPGDFAQALMELGATICTPRSPSCGQCPLREPCRARELGNPQDFPPRKVRAARRLRQGAAFLAFRPDGAILLEKRPEAGILAGMSGLPGSDWSAARNGDTGISAAPFAANWIHAGRVSHVFTHFTLELELYRATGIRSRPPPGCWWEKPESLADAALPSLFRKAIELGATGEW